MGVSVAQRRSTGTANGARHRPRSRRHGFLGAKRRYPTRKNIGFSYKLMLRRKHFDDIALITVTDKTVFNA